MLNDMLNTLKNFLFILSLCLFCLLIIVKNNIYKIKNNIRHIEHKIVMLDKEKEVIDLELTYLTSPSRLKNIYKKIKDEHLTASVNNNILTVKEQVRNIRELIPYYYTKVENSKNSIAQK